jgi:hypothetical protein
LIAMLRLRQFVIGIAVCLAASLPIAGGGAARADDLPASGTYQCRGTDGPLSELSFTVGPGNIYTTKWGFRGTMVVHPVTGNVLFRGAAPQSGFQGRYSAGPPPQVALVTVKDGVSSDAGITCQMR